MVFLGLWGQRVRFGEDAPLDKQWILSVAVFISRLFSRECRGRGQKLCVRMGTLVEVEIPPLSAGMECC